MIDAESSPPDRAHAIRVVATGDIMAGDASINVGWGMASRYPGKRLSEVLAEVAPLLADADLVIGNLEAPLVQTGVGKTRWARDQMRALPDCAFALRDAGFDVLTIANNHANQHGAEGIRSTVEAVEGAGLRVAGLPGEDGWTTKPVRIDVAGQSLGVLSYCWRPRQYGKDAPAGFAEGDPDDAVRDVARLKAEGTTVIVCLHWGEEFLGVPSEDEVVSARALVDAGATLIVGHHPHVTRPVWPIDDALVAFSLGNLASDMVWMPELRRGGLVRCSVKGSRVVDWATSLVETGTDYRTRPVEGSLPIFDGDGLPADVYARAVHGTLQKQRLAAYRHAAVNAFRFPPAVLAELVSRTLANKVRGLVGR